LYFYVEDSLQKMLSKTNIVFSKLTTKGYKLALTKWVDF